MSQQLTLGIQLRDNATFANFLPGDNHILLSALRRLIENPTEPFIYLWGYAGCGRSHLLQACCHLADAQGCSSIYLSLQAPRLAPQILEGLENLSLICIDDVNAVAGDMNWEEALFHCYNRAFASGSRLIITGGAPPKLSNLQLPDLRSRLSAGVVFQVKPLTDEQKREALQLRAKMRGFTLSHEVLQFLLHHYPRNMPLLFSALEKLDQASLTMQRKLTVPFVKQILFPAE